MSILIEIELLRVSGGAFTAASATLAFRAKPSDSGTSSPSRHHHPSHHGAHSHASSDPEHAPVGRPRLDSPSRDHLTTAEKCLSLKTLPIAVKLPSRDLLGDCLAVQLFNAEGIVQCELLGPLLENGIGVSANLVSGEVTVAYRATIPPSLGRAISPSHSRRLQPQQSQPSVSVVPPIVIEDAKESASSLSPTASTATLPPLPSLPALPAPKPDDENSRKDAKSAKPTNDFLQTVSARDPVQQAAYLENVLKQFSDDEAASGVSPGDKPSEKEQKENRKSTVLRKSGKDRAKSSALSAEEADKNSVSPNKPRKEKEKNESREKEAEPTVLDLVKGLNEEELMLTSLALQQLSVDDEEKRRTRRKSTAKIPTKDSKEGKQEGKEKECKPSEKDKEPVPSLFNAIFASASDEHAPLNSSNSSSGGSNPALPVTTSPRAPVPHVPTTSPRHISSTAIVANKPDAPHANSPPSESTSPKESNEKDLPAQKAKPATSKLPPVFAIRFSPKPLPKPSSMLNNNNNAPRNIVVTNNNANANAIPTAVTNAMPVESIANSPPENESSAMQFGAITEVNLQGLKRVKKTSIDVQGKGGCYQNEDAQFFVPDFNGDPDISLFGIFDGHGGQSCSHSLVQLFPEVFQRHWATLDKELDIRTHVEMTRELEARLSAAWLAAYAEVDQELLAKGFHTEGATGTTCLIWRPRAKPLKESAVSGPAPNAFLQIANVGDSTAYLWDGKASLKLTTDHKVTDPAERERIVNSGIALPPQATRLTGGIALSRAFGDHLMKTPEQPTGLIAMPYVTPVLPFKSGHRLIVASDGLWDIVNGKYVFDIVAQEDDPNEAVKTLVHTATSSLKCHDNVSVIAVFS